MKSISEIAASFISESNHIERIDRPVQDVELDMFVGIVTKSTIGIPDLENAVDIFQKASDLPPAPLRDQPGMNVQIGNHFPPRGGYDVRVSLERILTDASPSAASAYCTHLDYEHLHPFMDGNGRSGRLLWAWQMVQAGGWASLKRQFLHMFYYQTLSERRV